MAYTTLAEVKLYAGITTTNDDVLLEQCITRAQRAIDTYCKRTFEALSDTTRYFDAVADVNGRLLYLDHDLTSVTSITNGDGTTVGASNYVLVPANYWPAFAIQLKSSSNVTWTYNDTPENAIAVVGRWAYALTAPADVVQACVRLAAWFYRQKDNSADIDQLTTVGGAVLVPPGVPKDVQALLKGYIR